MKNLNYAPLTGLTHIDQKLIANDTASDIVKDLRQAQIDGELTNKEISDILNFYLPDLYDRLEFNELYYLTKGSFALVLKNHTDPKLRQLVVDQGHALNELINDKDRRVRYRFINNEYRFYWPKLINDPHPFIRSSLAEDKEMAPYMLLDKDINVLKTALETISDYDPVDRGQYLANMDMDSTLKAIKEESHQLLVLDYIKEPELITYFKEHGETETVRNKASQKLQ